MIKTLTIAALVLGGTIAFSGNAEAGRRGCRCYGSTATPYVAQATAGAEGVRSYSYEPGVYVAPQARVSYYGVAPGAKNPFRDAGGKSRGE